MSPPVRLLIVAAIIGAAIVLAPGLFLQSAVRGAGWGIGREAAHALFRTR